MAILKGTMSYTRFSVKSESELGAEFISEKLNLFKFRPLHELGEDNETMGFCPYLFEYDYDRPIGAENCLYDGKIVMSLRIDTLTLPKQHLKALVKKSLLAYQRDHKRLPDRTVKKEIERAEAKALRSRVLPKTKIVEAIWCQKSHELRVFSRSPTVLDRFSKLFEQTFLLRPERREFSFEAMRVADSENSKLTLEMLSHKPVFSHVLRTDVQ